MGSASWYGSERQATLPEDGTKLNCWRSKVQPRALALLHCFFSSFSQAYLDTATVRERDKLFVLELCDQVGCC